MVVVLLFAAGLVFFWLRGSRRGRNDAGEAWLPRELRGAHLAYAEQTFRSPARKLVARIDRAYRLGGQLTLVELKTRARAAANPSDVIELSVQRLALQDQTGEHVSMDAIVLVQDRATGARLPIRVRLMDAESVEALAGATGRSGPVARTADCARRGIPGCAPTAATEPCARRNTATAATEAAWQARPSPPFLPAGMGAPRQRRRREQRLCRVPPASPSQRSSSTAPLASTRCTAPTTRSSSARPKNWPLLPLGPKS